MNIQQFQNTNTNKIADSNQVEDPLTPILSNILIPDSTIRSQAENQINLLVSQNFPHFLISISSKLSEENEKKEIRQLSATLIKNLISNTNYIQQYLQIPSEKKQIIKNNILSTLASPILEIRKAAALAVAGICKIELPLNQWDNIFDVLINTTQNENLFIQLSSLTTLEYIYEKINIKDININIIAKLLNTYYSLLDNKDNNNELILTALKSLINFYHLLVILCMNKIQQKNFLI